MCNHRKICKDFNVLNQVNTGSGNRALRGIFVIALQSERRKLIQSWIFSITETPQENVEKFREEIDQNLPDIETQTIDARNMSDKII